MADRPVDTDSRRDFWEQVHATKPMDGVSWWQPVPELSLGLIEAAGIGPAEPIIDVGAGWSTLVDHLVARGFGDVTVVDVSATALATVSARLGDAPAGVSFVQGDVLDLHPARRYALWHDRAVFHFLTEPHERAGYRESLRRTLRPGGHLVVATFGADGPTACSGLPVVRYSPEALAAEFADEFDVVTTSGEDHATPWGSAQQFTALLLRHRD